MSKLRMYFGVLSVVMLLMPSVLVSAEARVAEPISQRERLEINTFILTTISGFNRMDPKAIRAFSADARDALFWGESQKEILAGLDEGRWHPIELLRVFDIQKLDDGLYSVGLTYAGLFAVNQLDTIFWVVERGVKDNLRVLDISYPPAGSVDLGTMEYDRVMLSVTKDGDLKGIENTEAISAGVPVIIAFNNSSGLNLTVSIWQLDEELVTAEGAPPVDELQDLLDDESDLLIRQAITTFSKGYEAFSAEMAYFGGTGCYLVQLYEHSDLEDRLARVMLDEIAFTYCTV